ncbi:adenylylsulfate reductase [Megasphaera cerevisiae DSM 20462]|uniref:Adenylylsulfate reductase n=1 Tax=Megasphaera cerevisiae DSM 20462 TaxID=1122219 RepID=A0A0J6WUN6_9FIRM|nr:ferredoxin family protein [Megasphaera cerevisiae]KMO86249.1 adenylylsulfate reductase [Megasphaera cerevisiae DSM 20462]SKA20652.1 dissimilatory adenylylsulfate reductase beta subunit [Megasphaera cerevisiae DSM 20462]
MSIRIEQEKCVGCGQCTEVCPGSLIELNSTGKAYMRYPRDCWGCVSCVKECSFGAIEFFLGADIGGIGSKMHVEKKKSYMYWRITTPDGEVKTICIDTQKSNAY